MARGDIVDTGAVKLAAVAAPGLDEGDTDNGLSSTDLAAAE